VQVLPKQRVVQVRGGANCASATVAPISKIVTIQAASFISTSIAVQYCLGFLIAGAIFFPGRRRKNDPTPT
jgi:hypothetical protein